MLAVVQHEFRRVDQAQETFVHERGGVEMGDAALRAQPGARDLAQLGIQQGEHLIQRAALALRDALQ